MPQVQEINQTARTPFFQYKTHYINFVRSAGDGLAKVNVELRTVKDPNANPLKFASKDTVGGYLFSWQETNIWPHQTIIINTSDQETANKIVRTTLDKFHNDGQKYTPMEIMHWLRWSSQFSTMKGNDDKSLVEWYPQISEPLPKPGTFVISTFRSFPNKYGTYTNLQLRAVKDLSNPQSVAVASSETDIEGYLLSCSIDDEFGPRTTYCQVRTCDPELAHEVFNFAANELEKNPKLAEFEVMDSLVAYSKYTSRESTLPDYKGRHLLAYLIENIEKRGTFFIYPD